MKPVDDRWMTNYESVSVKMKDGTIITGKLNIGEFPRVSDLFKQAQFQYIVLADAKVGGDSEKVVLINIHEIMWLELEKA
jgi:hypothetical protein